MPRSILLSQFFLPLSAVGLGRFVTSLDDPRQNYHNPICNASPEVMEKVQTQYDSIHHPFNHQNVASQLTTFFSSLFSKRLKASIQITADQAKTYYLNNTGQWFRYAVQSRETCEWIERTIDEGEDIYIVVAYQTLSNARIIKLEGQRAAGGNLVISSSTFIASGEQIYAVQYCKVHCGWFARNKVDEMTLAEKTWWERYDKPRYL